MADYKVIPSADPSQPGYSVQCPDGTIANQHVFKEERKADKYKELIESFSLSGTRSVK